MPVYASVNVEMLRQMMDSYWNAHYIVGGFQSGFSLGMVEQPNLSLTFPKKQPVKESLREKVLTELELGRFIGPFLCEPLVPLKVSPLTVIPKPGNKVRMIFNLSFPKGSSVNDNIAEEAKTVQYCSVADVSQWLLGQHTECHMAKVDLKDAYRIIPVRKDCWKYLGIQLDGKFYIDRCLPMGAASSCRTFQLFSDALVWMLGNKFPGQQKIFNYLDDFLIAAPSYESCELALGRFLEMLSLLRVPVSEHKTVHASTSIVFLGIGIETKSQSLFIPHDKAVEVLKDVKSFLKEDNPRVKQWQRTLGRLCHLSTIVRSGRIFLSSVYGTLRGILSREQMIRRRIGAEARGDLLVWVKFLEEMVPGRQFRIFREPTTRSPTVVSDASASVGYGIVFGSKWVPGRWPIEWRSFNIAFLELFPIYMAIGTWIEHFRDTTVKVICDNQAVVTVINKLYSKDKMLRKICKPLALLVMTENIFLRAEHIQGAFNVGPDLLSRGRVVEFKKRFLRMDPTPTSVPSEFLPTNFVL